MTFVHDWLWPAGGSGGVPGDIFGGILQLILVAIVTYVVYKPLRRAVDAWVREHIHRGHDELHAKLDHIILHSDVPNEVPGVSEHRQPQLGSKHEP